MCHNGTDHNLIKENPKQSWRLINKVNFHLFQQWFLLICTRWTERQTSTGPSLRRMEARTNATVLQYVQSECIKNNKLKTECYIALNKYEHYTKKHKYTKINTKSLNTRECFYLCLNISDACTLLSGVAKNQGKWQHCHQAPLLPGWFGHWGLSAINHWILLQYCRSWVQKPEASP